MTFLDFYLLEKTIDTTRFSIDSIEDPVDKACISIGQKLAERFGLGLNGWMEMSFIFTIPAGVPNEKNTIFAKNESEIIQKLKERFPEYLEYIMKKNFPNGYKPDPLIPKIPPEECEPLDVEQLKAIFKKEKN
jgi:hypothetical protein